MAHVIIIGHGIPEREKIEYTDKSQFTESNCRNVKIKHCFPNRWLSIEIYWTAVPFLCMIFQCKKLFFYPNHPQHIFFQICTSFANVSTICLAQLTQSYYSPQKDGWTEMHLRRMRMCIFFWSFWSSKEEC